MTVATSRYKSARGKPGHDNYAQTVCGEFTSALSRRPILARRGGARILAARQLAAADPTHDVEHDHGERLVQGTGRARSVDGGGRNAGAEDPAVDDAPVAVADDLHGNLGDRLIVRG